MQSGLSYGGCHSHFPLNNPSREAQAAIPAGCQQFLQRQSGLDGCSGDAGCQIGRVTCGMAKQFANILHGGYQQVLYGHLYKPSPPCLFEPMIVGRVSERAFSLVFSPVQKYVPLVSAQTMVCPFNVFRISIHLKSTTSRFSRHALIMQLALVAGRRNAPVHSDLSVIPLGPYAIKQLARRADIAVILFVVAEVPM
jgi:hypothetical protein